MRSIITDVALCAAQVARRVTLASVGYKFISLLLRTLDHLCGLPATLGASLFSR
jgi:hypothetical protein